LLESLPSRPWWPGAYCTWRWVLLEAHSSFDAHAPTSENSQLATLTGSLPPRSRGQAVSREESMREWKLSASKESRRLMVEARRQRRRQHEERQREAEAREVALRAALARQPDAPNRVVERLLTEEPEG